MRFTDKDSIQGLIEEMTLEEKLTLLTGESMFKGPVMEKYGIPSVYYLDGGTGANYLQMAMDAYGRLKKIADGGEAIFGDSVYSKLPVIIECLLDPTKEEQLNDPQFKQDVKDMRELMKDYIPNGELPGCFPPGIVLGSSWDPESIYECGRALGKEAHYYHIDVLLGTPNVNIHRDPLGGRLFEGYSEDPCLVSKLAPSFVKGIQDEGIIADVKHFAANNQETDRRTVNEHIPERALQEIYFPGFKACVQEGGCKTVMSAYNAINGTYCALNPWLLTDILKKEWGFEGFVVSDWTAAYDQVEAWNAGNDMDMPGPRNIDRVIEAVKDGRLSEEKINESLRRYLNVILEMPVMKGRRYETLDRAGSARAAYNSVKEAAILLKNERETLPLKNKGVSFYGEKSKKFLESGGGSANVITSESTSLYTCMEERLGKEKVAFEKIMDNTDTVVVTVGIIGQEGFDRAEMDIETADKEILKKAIKEAKAADKKIVVILNVCGPIDVSEYVDQVDAILCIFLPGMEGGRATADILLGEINPSGKLPITFPKRYRDVPSCGNFPGRNKEVWYGEGIFVGYRYYDYRDIEPQFPFGFGLSYTTFEIGDVKLNKAVLNKDDVEDKIVVSCQVRNTGSRTGKEVVQLYIGEKNPALVKPPKELKNFQKLELRSGEEKEVSFDVTANDLASYDEVTKKWIVQPDDYTLYIGNSSRSIAETVEIQVEGWNPFGISEESPLGTIATVPGALDKLMEFVPKGTLSRQMIEMQILFQDTGTLKNYWKESIAGFLTGSEEEKVVVYQRMLKAMNQFVL